MEMQVLDVFIGLVLVYLVFSLVCTTVVEAISQHRWFRYRAKTLNEGLRRMMGATHCDALLARPEIRGLVGDRGTGRRKLRHVPSKIPPETFAAACLQLVDDYDPDGDGVQRTTLQKLTLLEERAQGERNLHDRERAAAFAQVLRSIWKQCDGDREAVLARVCEWFLQSMERVSGEYRRWAQRCSFAIAVALVLFLNADTVRMTRILYQSPQVRAQVVAQAEAVASRTTSSPSMSRAIRDLRNLEPLLGWERSDPPRASAGWWLSKIFGLLVTALALSMGAPFWFKTLKSLLKARDRVMGRSGNGGKEPTQAAAGADVPAVVVADPAVAALPAPPPQFADTFEPANIQHSHGNGYWLGKMSELAYQDGAGFASAIAACKPERVSFVSHPNGTQVHIASWANYAIVAFRGTEKNIADIATDLQFKLESWAGAGLVHRGFGDALDGAWPDLLEQLEAHGVGEDKGVWLAGHSLGGALAVLAASRLLMENVTSIFGVYTIGQPRVGDELFVKDLEDRIDGRYFRYINHRDAVPRAPTRSMKYHHGGKVLYFDGDGELDENSVLWTRLLDVAFGGTTECKAAIAEAAGDHSATEYVERLRRQLG